MNKEVIFVEFLPTFVTCKHVAFHLTRQMFFMFTLNPLFPARFTLYALELALTLMLLDLIDGRKLGAAIVCELAPKYQSDV